MARVRKLILTIASGSVLYSGMAPAIGLGEITINSALNQPLEAEIELLEVGDITDSEMRIALAPPDAFTRAGVDRTSFLDDLRFTTLLRGNKSIIRVESRKPVREPYLNFVVEMARPSGRVLREYTLLIDPPGTLADRPQAAGFQRSVEAEVPRMQLPAVSTPPTAVQGNTYQVARGDSLWKIARKLQVAGSPESLPVLMADIHALNPRAFVGGDIDRLISGATLLLPDRANPAITAPAPAVAGSAAVAAPGVPPSAPEAPPAESPVALVQQRLDEALAAQDQQRLQLQQQMNDLQSQLTTLRLQVADKDQQVEALQARLVQQQQPAVEAVPVNPVDAAAMPAPTVSEVSGWWSGWLTGFAGGGLLAALLGGVFWWRRRRPADPAPERVFGDYQAAQPVAVRTPLPSVSKTAVAPVSTEPLEQPATRPVEKKSAEVAEPDALDGANIYVAYGRLDEAREVLERALDKEPARNEVRLRLLELLAKMGDGKAFAQHEQMLMANAGDLEHLARIKIAHPDFAGKPVEPDPLEHVVLDLGEPIDMAAASPVLGATPLNLDDLALDAACALAHPLGQPIPASSRQVPEDLPLSGSLELPEVADVPVDAGGFSPFVNFQIKSRPADELLDSRSLESEEVDKRPASRNLDHLAGNPQSISRLNMALAYIDQGNLQSACDILNQLISEGDDKQKKQAREILARIA